MTSTSVPTSKKLFIVESPVKARTIAKFIGDEYVVMASTGHIADISEKVNAVDITGGFAVRYELTEQGAKSVAALRKAMSGVSEVVLATDPDREGELIAAHLVEFLQPVVPVVRVTFHAVTKVAVQEALAAPRNIDMDLVEAARTRRILDRLYGYGVTDVGRKRIRKNVTVGRVQSPAMRLVVEREVARLGFTSAAYGGVEVQVGTSPDFMARLVAVGGERVATGKDFNSEGVVTSQCVVVGNDLAEEISLGVMQGDCSLRVLSVVTKKVTRKAQAPFTVSSLYQDAGNRLGMTTKEVDRVGGELFNRGFITYLRSDQAVHYPSSRNEIREAVAREFGDAAVAPDERFTVGKGKNAQGAHEAIRPVDLQLREGHGLDGHGLNPREAALYILIWRRTMASQMADAKGETVTVRLAGGPHGAWEFSASGTSYIEEGFRAVYSDISGDAGGDGDNELPAFPVLVEGEAVSAVGAQVKNHNTLAPARFTEASLVKELEELGIGRPSTYSSIIGKLRARYVWSRDGERALIPTLTAFAVWRMLMENFAQLVDYDFTSAMEEDLDSVANGEALSAAVLNTFYFGVDDKAVWPGLEALVQHTLENVDPRDMFVFDLGVFGETGEAVVVRPGKMKGKSFSPYMECGKVRVSLPDETALDELTPERVAELMAYKEKVLGHIDAVAVMLRFGSRGYFFQLGATGELPSGWTKPRFAGLLSAMDPVTVTLADAELMLSLPRVLGVHPETGDEVCALKGLYGPYIKCAADTRQLPSGVPPIAVECSVTYGGA